MELNGFCLLNKPILSFISICIFVQGCDLGGDISGRYEESSLSGRHMDADAIPVPSWSYAPPERYFRFYFKQFDDEIGGVFESFDMSSRMQFTQVPAYMENPTAHYYCARIDYGYVRNETAYVFFTDREQRQWNLIIDTSKKHLSGSLTRAQLDSVNSAQLNKADYYLPEDREYISKLADGRMPYPQISLQKMEKDSKRSLDCVYYYKSHHFEVILPSGLARGRMNCKPSAANCDNIKLAVVGMPPQSYIPDGNVQPMEIMTARLDDCDISTDYKRKINLRENPYKLFSSLGSGIFIATVIVYLDRDNDNHWNPANEPVIASLKNQSLVFYDSKPGTQYGKSRHYEPYEDPVIREEEFNPTPGWHVFSYDSDDTSTSYSIVRKLTHRGAETLHLGIIDAHNPYEYCHIRAEVDDVGSECIGIIPVLIQ